MIRKIIFISIFALILSQESGGSLAFMNISPSSNSHSLGNTIASEIHSPTSLLLSPANIWQYSKIKASTSLWMKSSIPGVSYSNQFGSLSIKQWTLAAGHLRYGVGGIESYNELAEQGNDFNFAAVAFMFGVANKISNLVWGVGVNGAIEKFSIQETGNTHMGLDFGVTLLNYDLLNNERIFITGGMCSKNTLYGEDKIKSAYSTSSVFARLSLIFLKTTRYTGVFNIYPDLVMHQALGRYHANIGTQMLISAKNNYKISLNSGLSDVYILADSDERKYSTKFSCGISFQKNLTKKLGKIEFQFS